jgi:hypothetical protein
MGCPRRKTKVVVLEEEGVCVDGRARERKGSGLTALGLFWVDAAFVLRSSLGSRDCLIGCLHDEKQTHERGNKHQPGSCRTSTCKQPKVKVNGR